MRPTLLITLLLPLAFSPAAQAELHHEAIHYQDGDTPLQGYLVWDDAYTGKRPGIMVVHEWWGLNDDARARADKLAEAGYVAFAADMYGNRQVTEHPKQAQTWMQTITKDVGDWRKRAQLGLDRLKTHPQVDRQRLAAIGYCFGGATVMQMAYAGADLDAAVSFHGSLPAATEADDANIEAKILAFHGDADAFTPKKNVDAFKAALERAGADWQLLVFGGVRHSFTNANAASYGIDNLKYDANADALSWSYMLSYFERLFGKEEK